MQNLNGLKVSFFCRLINKVQSKVFSKYQPVKPLCVCCSPTICCCCCYVIVYSSTSIFNAGSPGRDNGNQVAFMKAKRSALMNKHHFNQEDKDIQIFIAKKTEPTWKEKLIYFVKL